MRRRGGGHHDRATAAAAQRHHPVHTRLRGHVPAVRLLCSHGGVVVPDVRPHRGTDARPAGDTDTGIFLPRPLCAGSADGGERADLPADRSVQRRLLLRGLGGAGHVAAADGADGAVLLRARLPVRHGHGMAAGGAGALRRDERRRPPSVRGDKHDDADVLLRLQQQRHSGVHHLADTGGSDLGCRGQRRRPAHRSAVPRAHRHPKLSTRPAAGIRLLHLYHLRCGGHRTAGAGVVAV